MTPVCGGEGLLPARLCRAAAGTAQRPRQAAWVAAEVLPTLSSPNDALPGGIQPWGVISPT